MSTPSSVPAKCSCECTCTFDQAQLDRLPPFKRYHYLRTYDPHYVRDIGRWPSFDSPLPNNLMKQCRTTVEQAVKEKRELSITTVLIAAHDAVGTKVWDRLRKLHEIDELGSKAIPECGANFKELYALRVRVRERYKAVRWLDNLCHRCLALEASEGIYDEHRGRERFKRFPLGVFPALEEREEAESLERGFA